MNSLSWLLYLADMVGKVSGVASFFAVILLLISGIFFVLKLFPEESWGTRPASEEFAKNLKNSFNFTVVVGSASLVLWFAIPSKNTVIQIAASEFLGQATQLEEIQNIGGEAGALVKDSLSLLRKYVNDQLGEDNGEATKE